MLESKVCILNFLKEQMETYAWSQHIAMGPS